MKQPKKTMHPLLKQKRPLSPLDSTPSSIPIINYRNTIFLQPGEKIIRMPRMRSRYGITNYGRIWLYPLINEESICHLTNKLVHECKKNRDCRRCKLHECQWMKPMIDISKQYRVSLRLLSGNDKVFNIARLVLEYFAQPIDFEDRYTVRYIDGNTFNLKASNLEWQTRSEQIKNQFKSGQRTSPQGEKKSSKLTETDVITIRETYKTGNTSLKQLALQFKVSRKTISHIVNRKSWKHI